MAAAPAQDLGTPLVTAAVFEAGAFADLVRSYDPTALARIMVQATRACETETGRRLAPFDTITESHMLRGVSADEYADGGLPMDLAGTVSRSYGMTLSGGSAVRHVWLREHAPQFADMWTYSNVNVQIVRSIGGPQSLGTGGFLSPDPDTGHLWFNVGTFAPPGSFARISYSGGYTTCPADLERACMFMAASIVLKELDPAGERGMGHTPASLEADAVSWLNGYMRAA